MQTMNGRRQMARMKAAVFVVAMSTVLAITGVAPAEAARPKSIVGRGATMVFEPQPNWTGPLVRRTVTVATVKQNGRIDVSGIGARSVNCAYTFTKSGVKMGVAATEFVRGRRFLFFFSEGGVGHAPWALVWDTPISGGGASCIPGVTALPVDLSVEFQVPAKRYQVVGG